MPRRQTAHGTGNYHINSNSELARLFAVGSPGHGQVALAPLLGHAGLVLVGRYG